ncbi:MAG TPA: serine/threonine-protein kinase, partial [Polyangiales bacterium]
MRRPNDEPKPAPFILTDEAIDAPVKVADRFVLHALLGRGGSGAVYRAYDEVRGATVALKFLTALDPGSVFRFKSEFRILANLAHRNLLQLYELLAHEDDWLLTMELVEGSDFLSYLRPRSIESDAALDDPTVPFSEQTTHGYRHKQAAANSGVTQPTSPIASLAPVDDARLRRTFLQLCEGLDALHRADRLHRDLKPANVLVSSADERVVICDFGLALEGMRSRVVSGDESIPDNRFGSRQREIAGTLPFMSPEQANAETLTPASDWYSVGVM